MRTLGLEKSFKVEGVTFELIITSTGSIQFGALPSASKRGRIESDVFTWGDIPSAVMEDTNIMSNPMTVFNKVGGFIVDWVGRCKPYRFGFVASTERKQGPYRWMANKLLKKIYGKYTLVEHPTGTFSFYKQVQ
jgi:hypothetical protein